MSAAASPRSSGLTDMTAVTSSPQPTAAASSGPADASDAQAGRSATIGSAVRSSAERPAPIPADPAVGRWQHTLLDGRVQCDLCPRACRLREGQRGFCFVRANHGGRIVLDTYGRSSGFAIDPVEKKPLNHFLPGSRVLSFGTAGCNSACRFCQNWEKIGRASCRERVSLAV